MEIAPFNANNEYPTVFGERREETQFRENDSCFSFLTCASFNRLLLGAGQLSADAFWQCFSIASWRFSSNFLQSLLNQVYFKIFGVFFVRNYLLRGASFSTKLENKQTNISNISLAVEHWYISGHERPFNVLQKALLSYFLLSNLWNLIRLSFSKVVSVNRAQPKSSVLKALPKQFLSRPL